MGKVNEQFGKGSSNHENLNEIKEEEDYEVVTLSTHGKEDAKWQEIHLDSFLNSTANDQTLKIAKNLLKTTALTRAEIAQLTGIDPNLLEGDEEESDEEDDEGEDEKENEKNKENEKEKTNQVANIKPELNNESAVVIQANDFNKSLVITKSDMAILDDLIQGGSKMIIERGEDALSLLQKLRQAIDISSFGTKQKKTPKTPRNVQPSSEISDAHKSTKSNNLQLGSEDNLLANTDINSIINNDITDVNSNTNGDMINKFPCKYRVIINPGALVKQQEDMKSNEVGKLPIGAVVTVEEISGRRARLSTPLQGWCSMYAKDGRVILQKESTKSKEMEQAIAAERTHQTKVAILKSITTLNDATVVRILEKSNWNLRRAIEAFYIAKFKTQEFLKQKNHNLLSQILILIRPTVQMRINKPPIIIILITIPVPTITPITILITIPMTTPIATPTPTIMPMTIPISMTIPITIPIPISISISMTTPTPITIIMTMLT